MFYHVDMDNVAIVHYPLCSYSCATLMASIYARPGFWTTPILLMIMKRSKAEMNILESSTILHKLAPDCPRKGCYSP
jgi:hypothetical protein